MPKNKILNNIEPKNIIMREFYVQIFSQQNDCYSVVIEDDGKVAYAYLLKEKFTAKLTINSKPGWSTNVTKDGPLARECNANCVTFKN